MFNVCGLIDATKAGHVHIVERLLEMGVSTELIDRVSMQSPVPKERSNVPSHSFITMIQPRYTALEYAWHNARQRDMKYHKRELDPDCDVGDVDIYDGILEGDPMITCLLHEGGANAYRPSISSRK